MTSSWARVTLVSYLGVQSTNQPTNQHSKYRAIPGLFFNQWQDLEVWLIMEFGHMKLHVALVAVLLAPWDGFEL